MKKTAVVAIIVAMCISAPLSSSAKEWLKFDTQGHSKAKGLWLTVKYPNGWKSAEGDRPNIVRKFLSFSSATSIQKMLMLQVRSLPDGSSLEADTLSDGEWIELGKEILPQNSIIRNIKKIQHEKQNGVISQCLARESRAGLNFYSESEMMTIFYKDRMVMLACMTTGPENNLDAIISLHSKETHNVCLRFFNSLVFMDRY